MSEQRPSVVNLSDYHDKENEERKQFMLERLEEFKKAIEEDRLSSFVLQWEAHLKDDEDGATHEAYMLFWNEEESIDVAISKVTRLQNRLVLMADGFIGHE